MNEQRFKELCEKYPYLVAWCNMMGSFKYYLQMELEKAEELQTPTNVIYFNGDEFRTFDQVKNPQTIAHFNNLGLK